MLPAALQAEHISAVYFEACSHHISAQNKIKAVSHSAPLLSAFKNRQMFGKKSKYIKIPLKN